MEHEMKTLGRRGRLRRDESRSFGELSLGAKVAAVVIVVLGVLGSMAVAGIVSALVVLLWQWVLA